MVPIKIRFAFTGFILSFKTSLITNRMHMELITGARGGGGGGLCSGRSIIHVYKHWSITGGLISGGGEGGGGGSL